MSENFENGTLRHMEVWRVDCQYPKANVGSPLWLDETWVAELDRLEQEAIALFASGKRYKAGMSVSHTNYNGHKTYHQANKYAHVKHCPRQ